MARIVIKHNGKIPLISESYNKIGETKYPYGFGMLVTILSSGSDEYVVWSTNGSGFTSSQSNIGFNTPAAIAFSPLIDRLVVFGGLGASSPGLVMYSDNLTTWATASTTYTTGQDGYDIDYSELLDIFVAVGENKPQSSTNGLSWTLTSTSMGTLWQNVKWIDVLDKFVVSNISSSPYFASSTDGLNWTTSTAVPLIDIAYSTNLSRLVGVDGSYGAGIAISDNDGSTWTYITQSFAGITNFQKLSIAYSEDLDLFVVVGATGSGGGFVTDKFITSKTGLTWSQVTGVSGNWNHINWSPQFQKFYITQGANNSSKPGIWAQSSNGVSWATSSVLANLTSGQSVKIISPKRTFV